MKNEVIELQVPNNNTLLICCTFKSSFINKVWTFKEIQGIETIYSFPIWT